MDKEKQIEEMAKILGSDCGDCQECECYRVRVKEGINACYFKYAEMLYNAGWHKQSEGEWMLVPEIGNGWYVGDKRVFPKYCSVCKATYTYGPYNYCPDCGAKMKGADNDRAD